MSAATGRDLTFAADIEDLTAGLKAMRKIANPVRHEDSIFLRNRIQGVYGILAQ